MTLNVFSLPIEVILTFDPIFQKKNSYTSFSLEFIWSPYLSDFNILTPHFKTRFVGPYISIFLKFI